MAIYHGGSTKRKELSNLIKRKGCRNCVYYNKSWRSDYAEYCNNGSQIVWNDFIGICSGKEIR